MAYVPTVWENDITEVDEDNMNHIEEGIKNNDDKLQGVTSMGNIQVDSIESKNLFNKNNVFIGIIYANGSIGSNETAYRYTDYIPITKNKITLSGINTSGGGNIIEYNSNKEKINNWSTSNRTLTLNSNTKYIRFSLSINDLNTAQLEYGESATSYVPYKELNMDYGFGDWTPVIENATVNYTRQSGIYIKMGKLVFIAFNLRGTITAISSPAYAFITGLPFVPRDYLSSGSFYEYANCFNDNTTPRLMRIGVDPSHQSGFVAIQNGNTGGMNMSFWYSSNNTFYLSGSGFYIVD